MRWWRLVCEDYKVVAVRDPATKGFFSIVSLHTGFWAVVAYRVQHALWGCGLRWLARFLALGSRWLTGVEIHPAVVAGRRLFVDHGMGVVIGETAVLGDDVSIYQGVTLGGTSWQAQKRHPTIGNDVIIGAGAKVIGAIMVGDGARVGSNAVVVKDVPAKATVVGVPAQVVGDKKEAQKAQQEFRAYAQSPECVDPMLAMLEDLQERVGRLEAENRRLRGEE